MGYLFKLLEDERGGLVSLVFILSLVAIALVTGLLLKKHNSGNLKIRSKGRPHIKKVRGKSATLIIAESRKLIAYDRIDSAIENLLVHPQVVADQDVHHQIISISSNYQRLKRMSVQGMTTEDIKYNEIRNSLLILLEIFEKSQEFIP